ncbi:type IV secretion system protein [Legionella londiniensis]|uniref:Vir protein B5 n=1 Tax=Legionella londiniensis TaxID=45068 RepID=A0A0W0VJ44_9GAMM|nr:type IV secretion system protein [Legionella londiniensis]KTD20123.1 vir protein B5 [Legionella londiniensis]STX94290.1 protein LvhB5 [Legionella londiniensis]
MKKLILLILALSVQPIAHADLLGVEDAQMIAIALKQLNELQTQYRVLNDTYQATKSQVDNLNHLKSMNSGHYGFGDLNNGLDALQSWQSPVSTWQDALHNLSGGNPERYQALIDAYEKNHPSLSESNYARYTTSEKAARFKEDKAVNRAVQVQTTQSYNEINQHIAALHKLSQQIEKTANTKGAIDLNSRLITELGFIQLMSLRLQALMSQQIAQESLSELQDRAEMVQFNRLPNH